MATAAEARAAEERSAQNITASLDRAFHEVDALFTQLERLEDRMQVVLTPQQEARGLVSTEVTNTSSLGAAVRGLADRLEAAVERVQDIAQRVDL